MKADKRRRAAPRPAGRLAFAVVVAAILLSAAVRIRLADAPLERDEGEYAYAGQLVLQGVPPYELAYNMKFPGTYYAYAATLAVFGESPRGVRFGLLLVNAATIVFAFLLGRRLLGDFAGAVAAGAFALLSLDRWIMGVFAHATHFVALPVTAATWLLVRGGGWSVPLSAGVLLGVAVLMKQHAIVYLPFAAALVAWYAGLRSPAGRREAATRVGWLTAGAAIPFAAIVVLFAVEGVLGRFWFWTFRYASAYVSEVGLADGWVRLVRAIGKLGRADLALWVAAAAGLVALWARGWSRETRVVICGLLAASLLAIVPGLYFREHYFIVLLPAAALLVGVAAGGAEKGLERVTSASASRTVVGLAAVALVASYVIAERDYLFRWTPSQMTRVRYGSNPFRESPEIARYIREHTLADDPIAVLGSEPQIYFYAGRRSATGYIYTYPLMEHHEFARTMQDEMIRQIEAAHPKYLVSASIVTSWLADRDSERRILEWSDRYTTTCYDLVGIADIPEIGSERETTFVWDDAVRSYQPRSESLVFTFRRKNDAPCTAS